MRAYADLIDTTLPQPVPLENDGGAGAAHAHWENDVLAGELMSPSGTGKLSIVSVAALGDLGYVVDTASAEGDPNPPLRR